LEYVSNSFDLFELFSKFLSQTSLPL